MSDELLNGLGALADSKVLIKLLEMLKNATGWVISPKGNKKYHVQAVEHYIESVKKDSTLSDIDRAVLISTANQNIKQYINQANILSLAVRNIDATAEIEDIDSDWLSFFFEQAKIVSKEDVRLIWAKLLVQKVTGECEVPKKLIHTLSIIDSEDIKTFCKICSLTFNNADKDISRYPFVYIVKYPSYYNSINIKRYHLNALDDLGLIEYDKADGFVLPKKVPILEYGSKKYKLSSANRINNGNVRLTNIGSILYGLTERTQQEDFIDYCKKMWRELNIDCEDIA